MYSGVLDVSQCYGDVVYSGGVLDVSQCYGDEWCVCTTNT